MKTKRFAIGDRVRLTGAFLRNTGQIAGGEGQSRWTVTACLCSLCKDGRFVKTDELRQNGGLDTFTPDELANEPHLAYRHINAHNLERCR